MTTILKSVFTYFNTTAVSQMEFTGDYHEFIISKDVYLLLFTSMIFLLQLHETYSATPLKPARARNSLLDNATNFLSDIFSIALVQLKIEDKLCG